ncbi:hypothetical protein JNUCC0626_48215 [Lentzea sp. JNUCC 0626]|uniref:hypothetical protein n=1 Tax=Lentzea sp. JNUCC 0626 TaxID=3367513 RepID=UPI003747F64D
MTTTEKLGEYLYTSYASADAYNEAHPDAPMPFSTVGHNFLRSFTCAGAGLFDDLTYERKKNILAFLPGGVPRKSGPDRLGTVVATCWGDPPYLVLAENVSLRQAWVDITARWPTALSHVIEVLRNPDRNHSSS